MRVDCVGGSGAQWVAVYDGAEFVGWWPAPLDLAELEGVTVTTWARCVSLGVPSEEAVYLHEPAGMILGGVVDLVLALAVLGLYGRRVLRRGR